MVYEVYFDKIKNDLSNDNYSLFVRKIGGVPTRKECRRVLKDKIEKGYYLNFICKSTWEDISEKDIVRIG